MAEVREEAATLVVAATEKILREKIDVKKDEQLIKESLKNI
jgi:F0F1-type ATP synthase membrane subunit b/b'